MPRSRRRTRRSQAEWTKILRRFDSSDQSSHEFCRREHLSLSSFQRWRSRLRRTGAAEFVELLPAQPVTTAEPTWSLDIALPNGVQLRFRG